MRVARHGTTWRSASAASMGETRRRSSSATPSASTTSAAHRIAYPLRDWPPPRRQWKPRSATAKPCSFLETPKDNISLPRLRGRVGWGSFPTKVPTVLRVRSEETRLPRRTTEVAICRADLRTGYRTVALRQGVGLRLPGACGALENGCGLTTPLVA